MKTLEQTTENQERSLGNPANSSQDRKQNSLEWAGIVLVTACAVAKTAYEVYCAVYQ